MLQSFETSEMESCWYVASCVYLPESACLGALETECNKWAVNFPGFLWRLRTQGQAFSADWLFARAWWMGLVNMFINVKQWQRLGLTFVAGALPVTTSGVLRRYCWAVVWLIQSLLKQGLFQGGVSLLWAVQSWPVCSMKGGCTPHSKSSQGLCRSRDGGRDRWGCDKFAGCINSFGAWKSQRLNHKVRRRILFWKSGCKFADEVQYRPISV